MATVDEVRAELVRSRGFIRGAETQLTKSIALLDDFIAGAPVPAPVPVPDPDPVPPPAPASGVPQPTGHVRFDTRAGGARSIQGASSLADALSASGFSVHGNGIGGIAFTTNADGAGARAFRFDWKGVSATTEIDLMLYRGMGGLGLNNAGEVWLQWKLWQSRTPSGGGIGTAGSWNAYSQGPGSGKRLVWFRGSGNNTGRFTFAPGSGNRLGQFFVDSSYNPSLADVAVDWDGYVSQWITLTFRFKPDSSSSSNDGILEAWFNDIKVKSIVGANLTHFDFTGELQIGGPTWIGCPQDQSMYLKDIVVWQP